MEGVEKNNDKCTKNYLAVWLRQERKMYFLVIQTAILSILFIFMVHNIVYFFQDNLTIPKTKDLVSLTEKKYEEIYNVMKHTASSSYNVHHRRRRQHPDEEDEDEEDADARSVDSSTTFIDSLPTAASLDMKEELKNFLKLHQ